MVKKQSKYRFIKRALIALFLLFISFHIYVLIANRNSKQMTVKQKVLKAVYPAFLWIKNKTGNGATIYYNDIATPLLPFYSLKCTTITGKEFDFAQLKGKKVLLVNTASDCGYTAQYDELQKLCEKYKEKLVVIGFPANDFKEQEKATDEEVARFCKQNFQVTFPLMKKSIVIKNDAQNKVFGWLTDAGMNGWNSQQPEWNFSKYVVDENGTLVNYFGPAISPLGKEMINAIESKAVEPQRRKDTKENKQPLKKKKK